jgi:hypothetical protein
MIEHCGPNDRKKVIQEKIENEDSMEYVATSDSRVITGELLEAKGYTSDDIMKDTIFPITVGEITDECKVDYIITLEGKKLMVIKCAMAVDSRERHVVAIARCVNTDYPIPYAIVTDGLKAHVLNAMNGKLIDNTIAGLPTRDEAIKLLHEAEFKPLPQDKREREMRVLQAFEAANATIYFGEKDNSTIAVKSNFNIPPTKEIK